MSRFNTGNSVPSTDPRDRSDNSQAFDEAVNSEGTTFNDRTGRSRRTWQSVEDQVEQQETEFNADQSRREGEFQDAQDDREGVFNQYLISAGYTGTGVDGAIEDYESGIEVSQYNQIIRDGDGEFWRASGSTDLPYTTTGAGLPEGGAFVAAGDAALRQDLGLPASSGGGAVIVRNSPIQIDTLSDLKAVQTAELSAGRYAILQGNSYRWVPDSTAAPDDKYSVQADDSETGRWLFADAPALALKTSESNPGTYNILHNPAENSITGDGYMNSILSGGSSNQPNRIIGNVANDGFLQSILGGYDNLIEESLASTIHSMHGSIINGSHSAIYGGSYGTIEDGGYQLILGGTANTNNGFSSVTLTSQDTEIAVDNEYAGIIASKSSAIGSGCRYCCIEYSDDTTIASGALHSKISGGRNTSIGNAADCFAKGPRHVINDGAKGSTVYGDGVTVNASRVFSYANGLNHIIDASYSTAFGDSAKTYTQGMIAKAGGKFAETGDAQATETVLKAQTDNGGGSALTRSNERLVIPEGKAVVAELQIVGKSTTGLINAYTAKVVAYRPVGGTTTLKSNTTDTLHEDDTTAGITISAAANSINVLCDSPTTTVNWVVTYRMTEVI